MPSTTLTVYSQEPTISDLGRFYLRHVERYIVYSDPALTIEVGYSMHNFQRLRSYSGEPEAIFNMDKTYVIGEKIFRLDHVEYAGDTSIHVPLKYYNKWNGVTSIGFVSRTYEANNVSKIIFTTYE
jgi:hypothetical protein